MSDWQHVQTIFLAAADLPPDQRRTYLEEACGGNDELRSEVESLLATDASDTTPIEVAVRQGAASLFDAQVMVGERLGIYRIVREIGRGGMGSVFLALRDDDQFRKEVALKIVRRGMDTADVLERFRYERQILANLEHPYIARLFDGGTTEDGMPFFVMEYIEGLPVDVYCRENRLNPRARCELFLRILEAVAYAHRNLVVHRDLKPANILITSDGTPKLLDFGVAKLLTARPDNDRTRVSAIRSYTPWYASPEQVKGLPITTSSDVYSLGVILYELLTGRKAQHIDVQTPTEIERVVCDTSSPRPSLQTHGLSFDLDNIVLMAMRKEPERRYLSVVQFADDMRRFLAGRTVLAGPTTLRYRVGKFIQRNRLQVASAGLVTLALVAGLVISLAQTRRAEAAQRSTEAQRLIAVHQTLLAEASRADAVAQRTAADQQKLLADQQRDQAQHQKALADQRVKDVLEMAQHTLFDVHDAIARLPGSVAARRDLVETMLKYLENLQKEVGLDDDMRQALCVAYFKIAMIQGDAQGASMQDFKASEANLLQAQTLLMPAYKHNPNDSGVMLRLIEVRSSLADLMYRSGRRKEGAAENIALLPIAHKLATVPDCTLNCRMQEAVLENELTYELQSFDPALALEHANRGIALQRAFLAKYPENPEIKQGLGSLMAGGARAYRVLGQLEPAADYYRQSIEAREELLRVDPNNAALRRNLLIAYGNYATVLGVPSSPNLGRPEQARIYAAKGVALARQMAAIDPNNATARRDLGMILSRQGMIEPEADGAAQSLAHLQEAVALIEPIVRANPKAAEAANQLAYIIEVEGERQEALGRPEEARDSYRKSMALLQPFVDLKDFVVIVQYMAAEQDLALLDAATGRPDAALELSRQSLAHAESYAAASPRTDAQTSALAAAWSTLAEVQSKTAHPEDARGSAETSMQLWNSVTQQGILSAHRHSLATVHAILEAGTK